MRSVIVQSAEGFAIEVGAGDRRILADGLGDIRLAVELEPGTYPLRPIKSSGRPCDAAAAEYFSCRAYGVVVDNLAALSSSALSLSPRPAAELAAGDRVPVVFGAFAHEVRGNG